MSFAAKILARIDWPRLNADMWDHASGRRMMPSDYKIPAKEAPPMTTPEPRPPLTDDDPTPSLAEYRRQAAEDSNAFWRLQSGDHLNLLEEAIEEVDRLREENADLETRRLGWKIAAETGVDTIRELRAERARAHRIASQAIDNGERMSAEIERIGAQVADLIAAVRGLSVPAGDHSTEYLSGYADALFVARDVLGLDQEEDLRRRWESATTPPEGDDA